MTKRWIFVFYLLIGLLFSAYGNTKEVAYRLYLYEKNTTIQEIKKATDYLSPRAISRREKSNIPIDSYDIPIASTFFEQLSSKGFKIITHSKWQNTIVVACSDSIKTNTLDSISFIKYYQCVSPNYSKHFKLEHTTRNLNFQDSTKNFLKQPYGYSFQQNKILHGIKLHEKGFKGTGIQIAVIDEGFLNTNELNLFKNIKISGTHNFVNPEQTVYQEGDHGTKVLSCLAANLNYYMVGSAPEATYWLLKSENPHNEYPIEEDYWAAAIEFADSVGADVISSSLGYSTWDKGVSLKYNKKQLDGKSSFITRIASIAAKKGLLVCSSAGNEGNNDWEMLTFPADAKEILTVGAITIKKKPSSFTSKGFIKKYVKPDVVGLGSNCYVANPYDGNITIESGTSFAAPTIAGFCACLWQALPHLSAQEIIQVVQRSSSKYNKPTKKEGFGLPNFYKAFKDNR